MIFLSIDAIPAIGIISAGDAPAVILKPEFPLRLVPAGDAHYDIHFSSLPKVYTHYSANPLIGGLGLKDVTSHNVL